MNKRPASKFDTYIKEIEVLFAAGRDTAQIASAIGLTEAEVYNLRIFLDQQKQKQREKTA